MPHSQQLSQQTPPSRQVSRSRWRGRKLHGRSFFSIAVQRTCKQLLTIDALRYVIAYLRYAYYAKLLGNVRVYDTNSAAINKVTTSHNLQGLGGVAVIRSNQLLRPLSVLDPVYTRLEGLDVLSIGPRTEGEILNIWAHGFSLKKIRALDLVSYSPWITLGDMHQMPYQNNSFDVAISGWVIAYSEDKRKAAQEMIRVLRPGGMIAVGVAYYPPSKERLDIFGKPHVSKEKFIESADEIISFFGDAVDKVYLHQDVVDKKNPYEQNLLVIFSVKK